jgi:hypothetical protein
MVVRRLWPACALALVWADYARASLSLADPAPTVGPDTCAPITLDNYKQILPQLDVRCVALACCVCISTLLACTFGLTRSIA